MGINVRVQDTAIYGLTEKSCLYTSIFDRSRSAFPAVAAGLRGRLEGGGGSPAPSTVNFDFSAFAVVGVALVVGPGEDAVESDSLIFLIGGSFFFSTGSLFSVAAVTPGPAEGEGGPRPI